MREFLLFFDFLFESDFIPFLLFSLFAACLVAVLFSLFVFGGDE